MNQPLVPEHVQSVVDAAGDSRLPIVASVGEEITFRHPATIQLGRTIQLDPHKLPHKPILKALETAQDGLIFAPERGERMKDPSEYEELRGLGVTARKLVTEKDKRGKPIAEVTLWERAGKSNQPHYIIFTGKSGHIADTGPLPPGLEIPGYDRHAGLTFLQEIARTGAGFTVVTMRGYGGNKVTPSQRGFEKDIEAFYRDWKARAEAPNSELPAAKRVVIAGVSLGTYNAAYLAREMTRDGQPPALLTLVTPYEKFIAAADNVLRNKPFEHHPLFHHSVVKTLQQKSEWVKEKVTGLRHASIAVPRDHLNGMLKYPFDTGSIVAELDPRTQLLVVTAGKDTVTLPENSDALLNTANENGLVARQKLYPESGHANWPVKETVQAMQVRLEDARDVYPPAQEGEVIMRDGVPTPVCSAVLPLRWQGYVSGRRGPGEIQLR